MSFLEPDDYLIIMDTVTLSDKQDTTLTLDEMHALRSAGVKTIYRHAAVRLDVMQPAEDAPVDWSVLDAFVERARAAGLKMLIPCLFNLPEWLPDDYFHSRPNEGQLYGVPAYDNPEAAQFVDDVILELMARYYGPDCQIVYSIPGNGEFAMNGHGGLDYPLAVFVDWVADRQRILSQQHGEVWTAFHPVMNPVYWDALYSRLMGEFSDCEHYGIIFTFVQFSQAHFHELRQRNQARGMTYYGGTEYCQGLDANRHKLRECGVRMLTAPKHPYQACYQIEKWMLDSIRSAVRLYAS